MTEVVQVKRKEEKKRKRAETNGFVPAACVKNEAAVAGLGNTARVIQSGLTVYPDGARHSTKGRLLHWSLLWLVKKKGSDHLGSKISDVLGDIDRGARVVGQHHPDSYC